MSEQIPACVEMGDSVLFQKIQNEVVLLNMEDQHYYGLNPVGADMWENLIQYRDVNVVSDRLCDGYEADTESVRQDLRRFVRELLDAGLLKAGNSQPH